MASGAIDGSMYSGKMFESLRGTYLTNCKQAVKVSNALTRTRATESVQKCSYTYNNIITAYENGNVYC